MILPLFRLIIRANTVYFLHIVTCFVFLNLFEVIYLWNKKDLKLSLNKYSSGEVF